MTEIQNTKNIYFTSNENLLKAGVEKYSKTPELQPDSVELSTKPTEKSKKNWKLILAGIATTALAIFGAVKTHKFIKGKKLQQIAEEEARRAAEEARRLEEEARKAAEEARKAAEEAQRLKEEAQQRAQAEAEKARRLKEEAEEAKRIEAERLKAEEAKRLEAERLEAEKAEKLKAEEAERLKAEEAKRLEAERLEAEKAEKLKAEEAERLKAEEAKRLEAERLEAEKAEKLKAEEAERLKAEEAARIESLKAELNNVQRLRPQGLAEATNIGVNFGEDLTKLVQEGRVTPEELQKLVQKHLHTDKVEIHSMSDYYNHGPVGVNAEKKAATTRAHFTEDGKFERLELFIPDLKYRSKDDILEYIDKATHEITHAAQFIANKDTPMEHYASSIEGRLLNYIQKIITDQFIGKMVTDTQKGYMSKAGIEIFENMAEYNKFMDSTTDAVTRKNIGQILKLGADEASQKQSIDDIYNLLFNSLMKNMQNDPNLHDAVQKAGGYEEFSQLIKKLCVHTFRNEEEAYRTAQVMRQQINGTVNETTYNDLIHTIMGMCADSLS